MRKLAKRTTWLILLTLVAAVVHGAPGGLVPPPANDEVTKVTLKQQIHVLMKAREVELAKMAEEYKAIPPEERAAFELRSAQLAEEYDHAYYSLLVEYHRLTGNNVEMERAQHLLDALAGAPQEVRTVPLTTDEKNAVKGGVTHEE